MVEFFLLKINNKLTITQDFTIPKQGRILREKSSFLTLPFGCGYFFCWGKRAWKRKAGEDLIFVRVPPLNERKQSTTYKREQQPTNERSKKLFVKCFINYCPLF